MKWMITGMAALIGVILGVMRYHQRAGTSGGEIDSGIILGGLVFIVLVYLIWREDEAR